MPRKARAQSPAAPTSRADAASSVVSWFPRLRRFTSGAMPALAAVPAAVAAASSAALEGALRWCRGSEPLLHAYMYTALFVMVPTLMLWFKHSESGAQLSLTYMLLSLFVVINTMISVWEIALHVYSSFITDTFHQLKKATRANTFPPVFMFQPVRAAEALSLKYWANVWILYSFFDASYADPKSYGFWIDSGNGFSTLLPGLLFAVGLTYDVLDARLLGVVGILQFYQEFYGTILYFWSFCYNRRWEAHGWVGSKAKLVLATVMLCSSVVAHYATLCVFVCLRVYSSVHTLDHMSAGMHACISLHVCVGVAG